jgi:glycosyltransferase involved in cell wall biosynthesis
MNKRILFISHNAMRTGAPILLLHFMRWLKSNSDLRFDVLLGDAGELLPEFQALAPTTVEPRRRSLAARVKRKLLNPAQFARWEDATFQKQFRSQGYGLIYANTVCNVREMRLLSQLGIPVLCHVHELEQAVDHWVGRDAFSTVLPHINHFVAVSQAVQEYLSTSWSIAHSKISLVHGFIPANPEQVASHSGSRETFRRKLGIAEDEILVGGCGTLDWRKGADVFVQLARTIKAAKDNQKFRFVWIGGKRGTRDLARFQHDLTLCRLSDTVSVVETCPNPLDYLASLDIFALTSREDPFPLVMLEAASLGLPIVYFRGSGGAAEFISGDAGLDAPYLDVARFAENIFILARDHKLRNMLGSNAAQKVRSHHTVEHQAPKLLEVINSQLSQYQTPLKSLPIH